jgi:hypothetical protein
LAETARALVRRCVAELGIQATIVERDGDYASPSVRVDGKDVMGEPPTTQRSCRLDVPTASDIIAALRGAAAGGK